MISQTYNRDCLEAMREMADNAFELAIVDPPFGLNITKIWGSEAHGYKQWEKKDWDAIIPSAEYFSELLRVAKNQIIWGGNYFTEHLPPTMCWLIWDKGQREFSMADGEMAWTSFNKAMRMFTYARANANAEGRIHPTQKPVALYKWLLTNYAKPGDKILDTHLGSGSSRIAAYDLGFDFTGYELDMDYYNAQEERFQRHIAQPKLFVPESMPMKQEAMFA